MADDAAAGAARRSPEARLDALTAEQYLELRLRVTRMSGLDGADLDEVLHAALFRLLRGRVAFASEEHLYACVLRTVRWLQADQRRRRPVLPLHEVDDRELGNVADPADVVTRRLEARRVLGALLHIGPRQRDVMWLHHVEDQSRAEVAARLDMSLSAVDVALHRGRKSLRRLLASASVVSACGALSRSLRPLRSLRARAVPVASRVGVVLTLVAGPVGVGVARWRVDRPLRADVTAIADTELLFRHGAPRLTGFVDRGFGTLQARVARDGADRRTTRAGAGAHVCVVSRPLRPCAGAGSLPDAAGDTFYVIIPGSLVGAEDVPVYVRDERVPFCSAVPTTDYTGCRHRDPQPPTPRSLS